MTDTLTTTTAKYVVPQIEGKQAYTLLSETRGRIADIKAALKAENKQLSQDLMGLVVCYRDLAGENVKGLMALYGVEDKGEQQFRYDLKTGEVMACFKQDRTSPATIATAVNRIAASTDTWKAVTMTKVDEVIASLKENPDSTWGDFVSAIEALKISDASAVITRLANLAKSGALTKGDIARIQSIIG